MTYPFKQSVVRIRRSSGEVVGSGFLVSRSHVLTCAHVVDQAGTAAQAVQLDFPYDPGRSRQSAWVIARRPEQRVEVYPPPDGLDVALLSLRESPPDNARPARLMTLADLWSHRFRAVGFPANNDGGIWIEGTLRDTQASGWAQLDSQTGHGHFIAPGFSGAPVWDEDAQGVVGMVVAADRTTGVRAAFMIPVGMLLNACPELASSDVGRELRARHECLVIKPRVSHPEGRERQREDIEGFIIPALEQAGLKPADEHPKGLEIHEINDRLIRAVVESRVVVVDANCYEDTGPFHFSPYLFYFLALRHARDTRTVLVSKTRVHLPPSLQENVLTYERPMDIFNHFRALAERIRAGDGEPSENPVQRYESKRALEESVERLKSELEASKKWNSRALPPEPETVPLRPSTAPPSVPAPPIRPAAPPPSLGGVPSIRRSPVRFHPIQDR